MVLLQAQVITLDPAAISLTLPWWISDKYFRRLDATWTLILWGGPGILAIQVYRHTSTSITSVLLFWIFIHISELSPFLIIPLRSFFTTTVVSLSVFHFASSYYSDVFFACWMMVFCFNENVAILGWARVGTFIIWACCGRSLPCPPIPHGIHVESMWNPCCSTWILPIPHGICFG